MKILLLLLLFLLSSSLAFDATSEWGEKTMTVNDILSVLSRLNATGTDGSFVVFLVPGSAILDGDDAKLQFSIEDGVLGFDWVLLAQRNKTDKEKIIGIAQRFDLTCEEKNENGVSYVRCTGKSSYSNFAKELILNVYKVSNAQQFPVIYEGFRWPEPDKSSK